MKRNISLVAGVPDQRVNRPPVKGRLRPRVTEPNLVSKPRLHRNSSGVETEMVCFYCKKSGHKISECHALKKNKLKSVGLDKAKKVKVQVNLQSQVDRLSISLQERDKSSADQNLQMEAQQTQVVQLKDTLSLLQEQGTALKAGLVEKDAMLQKQAADYSSLKTEFEQNKDYVSKLRSECSRFKQDLEGKEATLRTMTQECQSHTEELHKRNESVVSLTNQLDTVSENNVKLESDNVSLKSSLDIYVTDNSNLKKVVAQRHAEVEVLTTSLLMLFLELK